MQRLAGDDATEAARGANTSRRAGEASHAEDAAASAARVEGLLSHMAHSLRSPLQSVNGYLDLTLSEAAGPLTTQQALFLRRARAGGERLRALVDDLALLARLDAGRFALHMEPTDLHRVIEEALAELRLLADDAGLRLETRLPATVPLLRADGSRLTHALRDLLLNAIRFTPRGGRVTVSLRLTRGRLALTVRDTGVGIAPDQAPHIFERFYQVEGAAPDERTLGQGLGLAVARAIVEAHGGMLAVESAPGAGSAFTIRLPRG